MLRHFLIVSYTIKERKGGVLTSENATNATPKKERAKTRVARERFIATLRDTANVRAAAQAAGVDRKTAYRWRDVSKAFAQQWDEALEDAVDTLEAAAMRRARDGVAEPVFWQGGKIAEVRKYSDVLLMFLMKAHRPKKYRETVNNRVMTWQDDLIMALRDGSLTPEEVDYELGSAMAAPIIAASGLVARRKVDADIGGAPSAVEG